MRCMRPFAIAVGVASLCAGFWVGFRTVSARIADPPPGPQKGYRYPVTADPGANLKTLCKEMDISWPPSRLRLIALKQEKVLEAWAADRDGEFKRLITYAITAASGELGPKRKEGDLQVPEGLYRLTTLNPQSRFHLSIRVDYPNATDIAHSKLPVSDMGGDIYVHGNAVSIGCIAIGDKAIEQVFAMAKAVPESGHDILICPVDFRVLPGFRLDREEAWVAGLYTDLEAELERFPLSGTSK